MLINICIDFQRFMPFILYYNNMLAQLVQIFNLKNICKKNKNLKINTKFKSSINGMYVDWY